MIQIPTSLFTPYHNSPCSMWLQGRFKDIFAAVKLWTSSNGCREVVCGVSLGFIIYMLLPMPFSFTSWLNLIFRHFIPADRCTHMFNSRFLCVSDPEWISHWGSGKSAFQVCIHIIKVLPQWFFDMLAPVFLKFQDGWTLSIKLFSFLPCRCFIIRTYVKSAVHNFQLHGFYVFFCSCLVSGRCAPSHT